MGIETGGFINDLDISWPLAGDDVSEGDNHLRLIKKVVKASFPGVDRASEYIYVHSSAPTVSVNKGRLWLDTSATPNLLKIYDGSAFIKLPISATVSYKLMGNDTVGWVLPTADGTANYPLTTTGSNVLAFAQIDTTAIANNAVDGTKIAMGSDAAGDVLYNNGTDYVRLAKPGTPAGEVLTFATSASSPSWTTPATQMPSGVIVMWSGAVSAVPSGWVICDGNNSTPNLTGKFVIHADADSGGTYDVGDTEGLTNTGDTAITTAQMPSHTHTALIRGFTRANPGAGDQDYSDEGGTSTTSSTGGGNTHDHTGSFPPYYALAYIMKT